MDSVRSGPFGQLFRPDNFVFGKLFFFVLMYAHGIQTVIFILFCLFHLF